MLIAILVGIAAIIVLAIASIILYRIAIKYKSKINESNDTVSDFGTLDNVGVAPDDPLNPDVRVGSHDKKTAVDPYSHLRRRFTSVGIFVTALFGILGAKIFSMQLLSGDKYTKQAAANATTSIKTPAPRGTIFDCDGKVIVKNRETLTVLAEKEVANNHDVLSRLSVVLGIPFYIVRNKALDQSSGAQSRRVIANDITKIQAAYISEHSSAFPGISIETRTIREYPYGALAAHVLGYTGIASEQELLDASSGMDVRAGDVVGKSGIESYYDSMLSGDHGERIVVSDADGNIVKIKSEISPSKGSDIYLTINAAVQYKADSLLAQKIAPNGIIGTGNGSAGSIVVMDVEDGSILAMSNYPTFKPALFTGGISQDTWALYNTEESHYPLLNRAIAGTYPAASTFKAFTGLAGLDCGYVNSAKSWDCKGSWDGWDSGLIQKCWLHSGHGGIGFRKGIVESCDIVFYEIGKYFFDNKNQLGETAMQEMIMKYNFGKESGIDLEGEELGRVPTPAWKREYFKDIPSERNWVGGDYANMAIGQGYVLITPIQLAVAYGALATGKLMKPHLLKEVKNNVGDVVAKFNSEQIGIPDVNQEHLEIIKEALHGVATENTSVYPFFKKLNLNAAAKTGTAEVAGKNEFAWTAAYAPYDKPKYVVSCIIEEGGGGSSSATPIAAELLRAALDYGEGKINKDEVGFVAGSTGKSVKIPISSKRTD